MARINLFAQALSSLAPGGAVAAVPTDAGGPPFLDAWAALGRTSSTAHAPVFQNGALVFDGVAEALVQWPRAALSATYSLPDALGTDAGKGFTITGLAYDPTDGTWWAGNHGIDIQVYDKLIPNQTSLVHLSLGADGVATKLAEFPLAGAANGPAVALLRTIQGVAVDTSDHTLWVADYDGYIYHVSVTGTILGRIQPTGVPNGLAYDSKRDALIYNSETTNRNIVYTISKTDAHVLSRVYVRGSVVDHIVYDATRDWILVTYGPNNATRDPYEGGKVDAIDMDPTSSTYGLKVAGLTSEALNAVEGIAIGPDGALYLADDGYHHLVSPANTINRIDSGLSPQPILGSHFDLGLTGWLSRSSSADAALISWDNPLEGPGVGLFVPAGTTDRIQLYANTANSTGRFGALFTGLDLTARHTYDFDINLSARTVGLYVDHVLTATQALQTGGAIGAGELQLAGVQGDLSGALTDFAPLNLQQAVADGRVQFGAAGIKPAAGDAGVQFISLAGVDQFTATSGPDRFVYATAADSPVSAHDVIDGFATGDLIDVARAQGATAALVVDGGVSFVGYAPDVSGNYQGFIQVDSVIGGDAIVAGGALLYLYGGSHGAVLAGSAAPDVIIGGVGADVIVGGGGADALAGGAGADRFVYGALSDSTPSAYDTIYDFQSASDVIDLSGVSGPVVAILHTETGLSGVFYGYDGASSFGGAVLAVGRVEAFDIAAPAGTAFVETGSAVGDTLVGGAAGDVLTGGGGADYLYGGGGADLFRYAAVSDSTPSAADYIADFQHGSDKIDLSAVDGGAVNIVHGGQGDSYVFFAPIPGGAAGEITVTGDVEPGDLIVSAGAVVVVTGAFTPSVLGGAPPTHLAWEHWAWIGSHAVLA